MESIYLFCVGILFIIAVFDLMVGVSNDAVNFLQSAIGSKAASFRTILIVAAIGIFIGASLSNGMMDIARHGIYQPQYFYFDEIMCILLAVMLTDVILLDVFNSLGLPTSTTVSMVFELLGGTFALALIKIYQSDGVYGLGELINTDKALSVIVAIFVSVAIAFFFGVLIQYLVRLLFKFNYTKQLKRYGALFGGFAITTILYFILFQGLKDSSLMTPDKQQFIQAHTFAIMGICFVASTVIMFILQLFKVNVLKIVVMAGTFALALAFAGNDLVNFIGVPLAGYSAYTDFTANANGLAADSYLMTSLCSSAQTPIGFLIAAGVIMVVVLFTSKKAHKVVQTSIALSRQNAGNEGFGTSPIARQLVRISLSMGNAVTKITPAPVKRWVASRFDNSDAIIADGAAFDLVRAAVNLVFASLLIALGTSLKLPLSTTYVTFMVAMGSSLADRAWGRESAVFRITGVISVIGGWFVTAGAAFISCFIIALILYYGGFVATFILTAVILFIIIRSQLSFNKKIHDESETTAQIVLNNQDANEALPLMRRYSSEEYANFFDWCTDIYSRTINGFLQDNSRLLRKTYNDVKTERQVLHIVRRIGTIGLSQMKERDWVDKGLYLQQGNEIALDIYHAMKRMVEPTFEHIDNNFEPIDKAQADSFVGTSDRIVSFLALCKKAIEENDENNILIYNEGNNIIRNISNIKRDEMRHLRETSASKKADMVFLSILQESQNIVAFSINLLKVSNKFQKV